MLLLALCGLCALQWTREFGLRKEIEELTIDHHWQQSELARQQALLDTWEAEIAGLTRQLSQLRKQSAKRMAAVEAERDKLSAALARARGMEGAIDEAGERIEQANERIRLQNERIAELVARLEAQQESLDGLRAQRDELVRQLNERTEAYNALVRRVGEG